MSVSKAYVGKKKNVRLVLEMYCSDDKPNLDVIAERLGTTYQNVRYIVATHLPPARYQMEKALRYSRSKLGELNPMLGKFQDQHQNWKGDCEDQKGYLTRVVDGKRYFVHRIVAAEMVGVHVRDFPKNLHVHHIDKNGYNNDPDNLAIVTPKGHGELDHIESRFNRLPMWVTWVSGTSKSRKTTRT